MEYYSPHLFEGKTMKKSNLLLVASVAGTLLISSVAMAWSGNKIDREVATTIGVFQKEVNGSQVFLDQAVGYLVFPRVIKVGLGFGAETGEGSLIVGGQTTAYYRTTAGSFGFQVWHARRFQVWHVRHAKQQPIAGRPSAQHLPSLSEGW